MSVSAFDSWFASIPSTTAIETLPGFVIRPGSITKDACALLQESVGAEEMCWPPFQTSVDSHDVRFDPFTVRMNGGPPATTVDGDIDVSVTRNAPRCPPVGPRLPQAVRQKQKRVLVNVILEDLFMAFSVGASRCLRGETGFLTVMARII